MLRLIHACCTVIQPQHKGNSGGHASGQSRATNSSGDALWLWLWFPECFPISTPVSVRYIQTTCGALRPVTACWYSPPSGYCMLTSPGHCVASLTLRAFSNLSTVLWLGHWCFVPLPLCFSQVITSSSLIPRFSFPSATAASCAFCPLRYENSLGSLPSFTGPPWPTCSET